MDCFCQGLISLHHNQSHNGANSWHIWAWYYTLLFIVTKMDSIYCKSEKEIDKKQT